MGKPNYLDFCFFRMRINSPGGMTCIETGTFQGLIVAGKKFSAAIREVPFEEEELHLDACAACEGHPMLEELLPEGIIQVFV